MIRGVSAVFGQDKEDKVASESRLDEGVEILRRESCCHVLSAGEKFECLNAGRADEAQALTQVCRISLVLVIPSTVFIASQSSAKCWKVDEDRIQRDEHALSSRRKSRLGVPAGRGALVFPHLGPTHLLPPSRAESRKAGRKDILRVASHGASHILQEIGIH